MPGEENWLPIWPDRSKGDATRVTMAAAAMPQEMARGKFQGAMTAHRPRGS